MRCSQSVRLGEPRKVLLRGLPAVALCAALLLGWTPPSQAAEKAIWGPAGTVAGGGSAFDLYRRLGVDTVQFHLNFAQTAPVEPANPRSPDDPAYRWPAAVDQAVREGARTGIQVALQVSRSPKWSNGGRSEIWRPRPQAFADFLAAAALRYPTVRRWMVWGEPNRVAAFRPNRKGTSVGPRAYAKLLDVSYGALKQASARNIVIGGMTYTGGGGGETKPQQWLHQMRLPNGRPPRLDWYGHNPFSTRFPDLRDRPIPGGYRDIGDLDLLSREVARVYTRRCGPGGRRRCGRPPKLWLSEYVIQSDHGSNTFETFVSRKGQAQWLTAAYRAANSLPSVAGLGWLALEDEPESKLSANFGLITADGTRKPSFRAFRRAPSRAFRPDVRVRRFVRLGRVAKEGIAVRVKARSAGRVTAVLQGRGQRIVRRSATGAASAAGLVLTLRSTALIRGDYVLRVDAPRGERVVRRLTVR
ncbi:MAG: hypothetical protein WKF96_22085 [Solirubrobacteraceae bacterium]